MAKTEKAEDIQIDDAALLRAQVAALADQVAKLSQTQVVGGGVTADQLEAVMGRLLAVQANAHAEAMKEIAERDRRDDVNYPRISVYSYPEGDKARPRPQLKCRMFWCGADIDWDTTTAYEVELLNQFEPGEYTFKRIGGAPEKLSVDGEKNAAGKISKLSFTFPTKEQRDTLPPMSWMLRDALGVKSPEEMEIERLRAELDKLRPAQAVA